MLYFYLDFLETGQLEAVDYLAQVRGAVGHFDVEPHISLLRGRLLFPQLLVLSRHLDFQQRDALKVFLIGQYYFDLFYAFELLQVERLLDEVLEADDEDLQVGKFHEYLIKFAVVERHVLEVLAGRGLPNERGVDEVLHGVLLLELDVLDGLEGAHEALHFLAVPGVVDPIIHELDDARVGPGLEGFDKKVYVEILVDPNVELDLFPVLSAESHDRVEYEAVLPLKLLDPQVDLRGEPDRILNLDECW